METTPLIPYSSLGKPDLSWLDKVTPVPHGNLNRIGKAHWRKIFRAAATTPKLSEIKLEKDFEKLDKIKYKSVRRVKSKACRNCWFQITRSKRNKKIPYLAEHRPLRCFYCDSLLTLDSATVDHVVPRSKGGSDRISNKVLACYSCNQDKKDRLPTTEELDKLEIWNIVSE